MRHAFAALSLAVFSVLAGCGVESAADPVAADPATACRAPACPPNAICIDPQPLDGERVPGGRIAVVWRRLGGGEPAPAEIGYDAPFDTGTHGIILIIREADVAPPTREDVLLCQRACSSSGTCSCTGDTEVAVGTVVFAEDRDSSGSLDLDEVNASTYGLGYFGVGWSPREHRPAPAPFDALFADDIHVGVHAYGFISVDGLSGPAKLATPPLGTVFDLFACQPSSTSCALPFPALRTPSGI